MNDVLDSAVRATSATFGAFPTDGLSPVPICTTPKAQADWRGVGPHDFRSWDPAGPHVETRDPKQVGRVPREAPRTIWRVRVNAVEPSPRQSAHELQGTLFAKPMTSQKARLE
jgi:hypothetical protein